MPKPFMYADGSAKIIVPQVAKRRTGDIIELGTGDMVSFVGADVDTENKFIYVR